jgi:hypothetical protein
MFKFTREDGSIRRGKITAFSVVSLVLLVALGVGLHLGGLFLNASLAPTTSKLQEKSQVYTAQNRIDQYNKFYDEFATYESDLVAVHNNIVTLNAFNKEYPPSAIAADPTGDLQQEQGQDEQNVNGAQTICATAAQAFNQDSRKVQTGAMFKGVDLSQSVSVGKCQTGSPSK